MRVAVVAERLACGLDPAGDGRIAHHAPFPYFLNDLDAGNESLAVLDQQRNQGEYLRLQAAQIAASAQLDLGRIKLEIAETVEHGRMMRPAEVGVNLHEISTRSASFALRKPARMAHQQRERSGCADQRSIKMPLVTIDVIKGVFSPKQKEELIARVTAA
jgi:hypothetical protein